MRSVFYDSPSSRMCKRTLKNASLAKIPQLSKVMTAVNRTKAETSDYQKFSRRKFRCQKLRRRKFRRRKFRCR